MKTCLRITGSQCPPALLFTALICPLNAQAIEAPSSRPTLSEIVVEPTAERWLKAMSDYLKTSKSYSFHADITFDDVMPSGQKISFAAQSDLYLRRPNGIYANQTTDTGHKRLWFDGKQITLLDPATRVYAVETLSGNTDKALDHLIKTLHFTPPLSDFLFEDPAKALGKNVRYGFVVGTSHINGHPCKHLAFAASQIDWQIWIEEGALPLPRKLVINYKTLPGAPQFTAVLSTWDFNTRLPDSLFQAKIPGDAMRIEFMKAGLSNSPTARKN